MIKNLLIWIIIILILSGVVDFLSKGGDLSKKRDQKTHIHKAQITTNISNNQYQLTGANITGEGFVVDLSGGGQIEPLQAQLALHLKPDPYDAQTQLYIPSTVSGPMAKLNFSVDWASLNKQFFAIYKANVKKAIHDNLQDNLRDKAKDFLKGVLQ